MQIEKLRTFLASLKTNNFGLALNEYINKFTFLVSEILITLKEKHLKAL